VLLWSYLNGNVDAERQVIVQLEPFLEIFEDARELTAEEKAGYANVLHEAQHVLAERDHSAAGRFQAMKAGIAAMRQNIDAEQHATTKVVSAMQVVWDYVDHDEMLHGRKETEAIPGLVLDQGDLRNAAIADS